MANFLCNSGRGLEVVMTCRCLREREMNIPRMSRDLLSMKDDRSNHFPNQQMYPVGRDFVCNLLRFR